ncbi:MAG: molybdopterin molybdotransferase MoeA [Chloroflexi bacterium]|nr:molybdopterin molybdotransferase MoeA [Chloroflexota bacterium]
MTSSWPDANRLVPPDEALAVILARTPRLETERVALAAAAERVLAADVVADEDMPPFAAATMDGFAVVSADEEPRRRVVGEQLAGYVAGLTVAPGQAARITTGSPLPPGADAVIQVELIDEQDGHVRLRQPVRAGANIRSVAADVRRGDRVLTAGQVLGPAEVGLLAGLGRTEVAVVRRPRVAVLATGDELVDPGVPPGPGQIRDSNRFSLAVAVARARAEVTMLARVRDVAADLRQAMEAALATADVLVTSGGVSMGKLDLVKELIETLGEVHLRRLFMKPGKPFHFATAGDRLLFGLPGNPVSSLVAFELLVRPALLTMQGVTRWQRLRVPVALSHDIAGAEDRIEFQRAVVAPISGRLEARTTGAQHSARLASLVGANALLVLPPRSAPYRAGEQVDAILLDQA